MKKLFASLGMFCAVASANTIVVNTVNDELDPTTGPNVSLREAIRDAGQSQATICFDPSLSGTVLRNAFYQIESPVGNPGGTITIDATDLDEPITLSNGNGSTSLANIRILNRPVRLKGLRIERSNASAEGITGFESDIRLEDCVAIVENGFSLSFNGGSLNAQRCEFPGGKGLSLANVTDVTILDSSIYHSKDAAIRISPADANAGAVVLRNSTFAENLQNSLTPGSVTISGTSFSSITIDHCSIVDNASAGLSVPNSSFVSNCLFARNIDATGNLRSLVEGGGRGGNSLGYNLADDSPSALSASTDITNTDTKVSRVGYFGGDRLTCFPLAGSPAIDGGNPSRATLVPTSDNRGFARNASSSFVANSNPIDIGAVESNPSGSILVTSAADSGAGSLRNAVEAAFSQSGADTHHIIIDSSLSGAVLTPATALFWEDNHNLNIDGSALATPLEISGDNSSARIVISSAPGDFLITGSLTSLTFRGIGGSFTSNRSQLFLSGGSRFGLQRLVMEDNRPVDRGTIDVFDKSVAFMDECLLSDNRQLYNLSTDRGGAAVTVRDAQIIVWNSTFTGNLADAIVADGGAIRLDQTSSAKFRHSTFTANEAARHGGAIHLSDGVSAVSNARFERCTFANNTASDGGAISAPGFSGAEFISCLFAGNSNTTPSSPETQDLYPGPIPGPAVAVGRLNWSDATATSRSLIAASVQGLDIKLAPTALYGGLVPTAPFLSEGFVSSAASPPFDEFTPLDAIREPGFSLNNSVPSAGRVGAVQRLIPATFVIDISNVQATTTRLTFDVSGVSGTEWRLETNTGLDGTWTPTNIVFTGGSESYVANLPSPTPEKFFIRFRVVD